MPHRPPAAPDPQCPTQRATIAPSPSEQARDSEGWCDGRAADTPTMDTTYCPEGGDYRRALYAAAARCDIRGLLALALARETAYEELNQPPLAAGACAPVPDAPCVAPQVQRGA